MEIDRHQKHSSRAGVKSVPARTYIIRTLTANDVAFWGADAFVSVALALFVVTFIEGATVLNVGVALMIHRVVGAFAAIPIGQWFDKHKGHLDEVWGLSIACMLGGFTYILLSFATNIWQLYIAMFFMGIFSVINLASWRILFYSNVNSDQFGQTVGIYQTLYSLGIGLFMAIGGFVGEEFGYDEVLLLGGLFMVFGSVLPLLIRGFFLESPKHKTHHHKHK